MHSRARDCNRDSVHTLIKLDLHFPSNLTEYDRDDSFPSEFEPDGILHLVQN